jgi:hypothetical protein
MTKEIKTKLCDHGGCINNGIKEITFPKKEAWEFPVRLFFCEEHYDQRKCKKCEKIRPVMINRICTDCGKFNVKITSSV